MGEGEDGNEEGKEEMWIVPEEREEANRVLRR